jgi:hypothetical protein
VVWVLGLVVGGAAELEVGELGFAAVDPVDAVMDLAPLGGRSQPNHPLERLRDMQAAPVVAVVLVGFETVGVDQSRLPTEPVRLQALDELLGPGEGG